MTEKKSQEERGYFVAGALSARGRVRQANEDAFALLPNEGLFIVSDGIGSQHAGDTASKIVVTLLPEMIKQALVSVPEDQTDTVSLLLRDTIVGLSQRVLKESSGQPGLAGMGATVVLTYIRGHKAFIAHMGDSRAYLLRQGSFSRLTDDHSVIAILLQTGEITQEEARDHPARGLLSRYIGMFGEVYPDVQAIELSDGDRLLLCTDGLTSMVEEKVIRDILIKEEEPQAVCRLLVDAANAAGGYDNITVLVVEWKEVKNNAQ